MNCVPGNFPQILSTYFYVFLIMFSNVTFILLSILLIIYGNNACKIAIISYLIYMILDRKTQETGGRPFDFIKTANFLNHVRQYFSLKLIKDEGVFLRAEKNYLFCGVPHGFIHMGIPLSLLKWKRSDELFPHHRIHIAAKVIFYFSPVIREIFLGMGGIANTVNSVKFCLNEKFKGRIVALILGYARDADVIKKNDYTLWLKDDQWFVKVAIETGASLVPIFSFNENNCFEKVENSLISTLDGWCKTLLGLPFLILKNYLPFKVPLTVVVGHPIEVTKNENPTQEEIDRVHSLFLEKLTELFENNKHKYIENADNTYLNII